jgi:hypothetical protein
MKRAVATVPGFLLAVLLPFCAAAADRPDCDPDRDVCAKKIGNREIVFAITPRPVKAMEELVFSLRVNPDVSAPGGIVIDLSMPGMYMGENRVLLTRSPDGTYRGKGVIPKCRSGRKLWKAAADIPGAGKVDFSFNVSY